MTRSPSVREIWPALDNEGARIAVYGIGESGTDLYVIDVASQAMLPLTVRADTSGLHEEYQIAPVLAPAFSPDGQWVAFPARKGRNGALELFVARSDGQQVLRVTELGHELRDYTWLDSKTILIAVRWTDHTLHYWIARWEGGGFRLEPFQ
ncbi:MAG: PD40 domain-containing protein [Thermoflexales bacterium]|nr:PD40 domain-containing protein [Thermoflexales bacterium]